MKRALLMILLLIMLTPSLVLAAAEIEIPTVGYEIDSLEEIYESLSTEEKNMLGGGVRQMIEKYMNYSGGAIIDTDAAGRVVKEAFGANMRRLATVIAVSFLCAAAEIVIGGEKSSVSEIVIFLMCGLCIATVAASVREQFGIASTAVKRIWNVTEASAPVLTTLLCACGANASGAVVQPMAILLCELISKVFSDAIMPLTLLLCVFGITGAITGQPQLDGVTAFIKMVLKWSIGLCAAFFLGSVSIRGLNAAGVDGAGVKAIKYAFDRSLPLVGGMVSGSYESLRAGAVLLKNAAGTVSVLLSFAAIFAPAVKLLSMVVALRAGAAVCMAAEGRISKMLSSAADSCTYMFAVTATVGMMYMVMMAAVLLAGAA